MISLDLKTIKNEISELLGTEADWREGGPYEDYFEFGHILPDVCASYFCDGVVEHYIMGPDGEVPDEVFEEEYDEIIKHDAEVSAWLRGEISKEEAVTAICANISKNTKRMEQINAIRQLIAIFRREKDEVFEWAKTTINAGHGHSLDIDKKTGEIVSELCARIMREIDEIERIRRGE